MCSLLRIELSICGFRFWHTTSGKNTLLPLTAVACSNLVFLKNVLTGLICAVDFITSSQFLASVFGIPFVKKKTWYPLNALAGSNQPRIHSNLKQQ